MKRATPSKPHSSSGFTLIEVLVVVIIIGVLAAIAAPGWLSFLNRQRVSAVRSDIVQTLRNTRQDAIQQRRGFSVEVVDTAATPTLRVRGFDQAMGSDVSSVANINLSSFTVNGATKDTAQKTVTFDHQGLVSSPTALPFVIDITVGTAGVRQCVVVANLLGSIKTLNGPACDAPEL